VSTTISHLPHRNPSPLDAVIRNWDDPNVRGLWESPASDVVRLSLVDWYLTYRDESGIKRGFAGIMQYWRGRCYRDYGWFGWTRVLDFASSLRQRKTAPAR
jgi:hypothetical protein